MFLLLFSLKDSAVLNSSDGEINKIVDRYKDIVTVNDLLKLQGEENGVACLTWETIPIASPIKVAEIKRISSDYGWRIHPIYNMWINHKGIDFAAETGTNVVATADGTVIKVKHSRMGYGNEVIIDHGNGYKTRYAHLDTINVTEGEKINYNTSIGTVGSTGLSTGPHLHYEIIQGDDPIDPLAFTYESKDERSIGKYFSTLIALEETLS